MRERAIVYLGLTYVVCAWALNTVLLKHLITVIDPLALTAMRFLAMTPLMFLIAKLAGVSLRFERRDLPQLVVAGAAGYGVYQYFWILGLYHTTPFANALLAGLAPIVTLAITAALGFEHVRASRWVGACVALFGVAIFEGAFSGRFGFRLGDILSFCAAATFAVYNVVSARLLQRYGPLRLVAITMFIGTLIILPGMLPALLRQSFARMTGWDWAIFAYAVIFPIMLTFPVWNYGIAKIGAARTSLFHFAVPILTGILSVLLLGARIESYEVAGALVCIAGMAIAQRLVRIRG